MTFTGNTSAMIRKDVEGAGMSTYRIAAHSRPLALIACAFCMASLAAAKGEAFQISHLNVSTYKDELRLDANIDYRLSEPVSEALENGIPIPFELEVYVKSLHKWAWNRTVSSVRQIHVLRHHLLSKQYLLEDQNAATVVAFPDLDSALMYQGKVVSMYVGKASSLDRDRKHVVRVRTRLLNDRLPLPLRMERFFSSAWRLESGWHEWPL